MRCRPAVSVKNRYLLALLFAMSVMIASPSQAMTTKINLKAIETIESGGNAKAFNFRTKATGLYQITPICLADWNQHHPSLYYGMKDLWNPEINKAIADWYLNERIPQMLKHYGLPETEDNVLIAYNWGIGNLKHYLEGERTMPLETANYLKKYRRLNGDPR